MNLACEADMSHIALYSLPVELYRPILEFIPTSSREQQLLLVCTVSRAFQREAERLLYRSVEFGFLDYARIVSFCLTIAGSSRLASLLNALSLPKRLIQTGTLYGSERRRLQLVLNHALKAATSLEHIHISDSKLPLWANAEKFVGQYLEPHILQDCTFHLRSLHDDAGIAEPGGYATFLSQQPGITEWRFTSERHSDRPVKPFQKQLLDSILPHLTTVDLLDGSLLRFLVPRPIRHAKIWLSNTPALPDAIMPMQLFAATLRHLCFASRPQYACIAYVLPYIITTIAKWLPDLESLSIPLPYFPCSGYYHDDLLESFSIFSGLETLILDPTGSSLDTDLESSFRSAMRTQDDCVRLTESFVKACPSLRRVAFRITETAGSWTTAGCAWVCFCRSQEGEGGLMTLEGFDILDGDSWRTL